LDETPLSGRGDKDVTHFMLPLITDFTGQRPILPSSGSIGVPPGIQFRGAKPELIA
jgi:hypothetical protein